MDSLFDEEIDEVGSEIEAYCPGPRCKADTHHTIVSMYEDEVRRVQCSVCADVHPYRKPRGETAEESAESSSKRVARKPTWAEAMAQVTEQELASCRPYSIRDTYKELDVVAHPTFDVGFVTELLPDNKVEVTFKDERRVLVHNRADLAAKMPGIADLPAPRPEKKRKKRKKAKAPAPTGGEDAVALSDEAALAQAKVAKKEAVERAAEAKRKLTTQLAAERIKALRGSGDGEDGETAKTKRGSRRTRAARPAGGASARKAGGAAGAAAQNTASPKKSADPVRTKAADPAPKAAASASPSKGSGAVKAGAKKTVSAPAPVKLGAKKKAIQAPASRASGAAAVKATGKRATAGRTARTAATTGPASKAKKAAAPAARGGTRKSSSPTAKASGKGTSRRRR